MNNEERTAGAERPTTPAGLLREAANLIEAHGWLQGGYGSKHIGLCAVGAIRCAAGALGPDHPAFLNAIDALTWATGLPRTYNIPDWNDAASRTKDEVVDALRRAAEQCEISGAS